MAPPRPAVHPFRKNPGTTRQISLLNFHSKENLALFLLKPHHSKFRLKSKPFTSNSTEKSVRPPPQLESPGDAYGCATACFDCITSDLKKKYYSLWIASCTTVSFNDYIIFFYTVRTHNKFVFCFRVTDSKHFTSTAYNLPLCNAS